MSTALAPITDDKRAGALLKAVGLDRVPPEQRELALAIADRYSLDLMLKHVVLIDGRPYITRDGLLHIAHRSGSFDGMEVTDPTVVTIEGRGQFWTARASVWRKDMSRPFTYSGRYPTQGGNQKYAPEMATKVAEVMALRRAFDVSAPVMEERWDADPGSIVDVMPEQPRTARDAIAARHAELTTDAGRVPPAAVESAAPIPSSGGAADDAVIEGTAVEMVQCDSTSDPAMGPVEQCRRERGHKGTHRTENQTWP